MQRHLVNQMPFLLNGERDQILNVFNAEAMLEIRRNRSGDSWVVSFEVPHATNVVPYLALFHNPQQVELCVLGGDCDYCGHNDTQAIELTFDFENLR